MNIEWEAKFINIDKDKTREKLQKAGATLVCPEYFQKRVVFFLPKGHEINGGWLRVRDEGNKITMSLKVVDGTGISDQKEINLKVDDFENARHFLTSIGCVEKSYQENKRELWTLDNVELTIDEWPFLEPFVELEGLSEETVREVANKVGFIWSEAVFGSTHLITSKKYGIPEDVLNDQIPRIVFNEENPYLAWLERNRR